MRWKIALVLALAAQPIVALAAAPASEQLTQSSQWNIDYDDDSCHLISAFGEGDQQVALRFTRYAPGDSFELTIFGKRYYSPRSYSDVSTNFGTDGSHSANRGLNGRTGNLYSVIIGKTNLLDQQGTAWQPMQAITPEQEGAVRDITIRVNNRKPVKLMLGSMAAPMRAMRDCTTSLVKSWGFDPAEQAALQHGPIPTTSPGTWLRPNDYPMEALVMRQIGVVNFRLEVDTTGKVSACHIQKQSNPASFAEATCRAITARASFNPAQDKDGKPVRSYFVETVRWVVGDY